MSTVIPKITSLADLLYKAKKDEIYKKIIIKTVHNLYDSSITKFDSAVYILQRLSEINGNCKSIVITANKQLFSIQSPYTYGDMCEYGWYDAELEIDVVGIMNTYGVSREESITRVFEGRV